VLATFRLQDFKGHRDTELPLGRFTMLVGDNGSGKTSVLEALWLQGVLAPDPVAVLKGDWSPDDLLRRGAAGPIRISSEGKRGSDSWSSKIEVEMSERGWNLGAWTSDPSGEFTERAVGNRADGSGSTSSGWPKFGSLVGRAGLYRLQASRIAATAYSEQTDTAIEADGTQTAVVLAQLKLGDDEVFERIEASMRRLVPSLERVRIRPARHPNTTGLGNKIYFDFHGAAGVPAHGASHGTLIVLALLTVLHGPQRPQLVLLDDFDHALHPRAQIELVRMIKELLDEFEDLQIVATTHSPYILDELTPSDVHAFALRDDGTVAAKRLSEHPEAEKTKGSLTAGQLWSLDRERDWVLG
jgi:predicted ATPase